MLITYTLNSTEHFHKLLKYLIYYTMKMTFNLEDKYLITEPKSKIRLNA